MSLSSNGLIEKFGLTPNFSAKLVGNMICTFFGLSVSTVTPLEMLS